MSTIKIIKPLIKYPKLGKEVKQLLQLETQKEGQVVIHGSYQNSYTTEMIRIWKSTFLIPKNSKSKSKLLHAENIAIYPELTTLEPFKLWHFTLIFSPLPKGCDSFDFIEQIPESGAFIAEGIARNQSDVYTLTFY